ncbi:MAG: tetratricopeptide repeat protein [Calothrix sp. SM1_5_4]|nr:tetratricopeptide repeat protein [Calothrix sp. SM1_5_4]
MKALLKKARLPAFLGVAGVVMAVVLISTTRPKEERIHLIAPQKNVTQVNPETLKGRVRQGVGAFLRDTLDGYLKAQNDFVYIVERNNKNVEVMALLCVTYLQLWPYAYQDSADTKTIATLVQLSVTVDPTGTPSATCRAVDLIIRGRLQEAKSLVESVLDSRGNDTNPPIIFYYLKGDLLESAGEHASAIGYLQSAQQLWPQWMLPFIREAQALSRLERYSDAARIYHHVLKNNPAHTIGRLELGLLEYKHFNHADQGEKLLKQAVDGRMRPERRCRAGISVWPRFPWARGIRGRRSNTPRRRTP